MRKILLLKFINFYVLFSLDNDIFTKKKFYF